MSDFSKLGLLELEDLLVGLQTEIAAERQKIAGMEYELRQAHRELERRLLRAA
jgi:hypothetical protein